MSSGGRGLLLVLCTYTFVSGVVRGIERIMEICMRENYAHDSKSSTQTCKKRKASQPIPHTEVTPLTGNNSPGKARASALVLGSKITSLPWEAFLIGVMLRRLTLGFFISSSGV